MGNVLPSFLRAVYSKLVPLLDEANAKTPFGRLALLGNEHLEHCKAVGQVIWAIAEGAEPAAVNEGESSLGIGLEDRLWQIVGQLAIALLTLSKGLFGALTLQEFAADRVIETRVFERQRY
jgi:hypothetical protein